MADSDDKDSIVIFPAVSASSLAILAHSGGVELAEPLFGEPGEVLELLSNLVSDHGASSLSGGVPLLLLGIRWVVRHRDSVFVACSTEQLGVGLISS